MMVTRKSAFSGLEHTLDLPVTQAQLDEMARPNRRLVQDIFPHLSREDAEFIKSGITAEEWRRIFPPESDEGRPANDNKRTWVRNAQG